MISATAQMKSENTKNEAEIKMSKILLNLKKLQKGAKNSTINGHLASKSLHTESLDEMQRDGEKKL